MFQRYLYPILAIVILLVSLNIVKAETSLSNQRFDSSITTIAWSDDASLLAVSTQTAIYILNTSSQDLRQLSAFTLPENANAPSKIIWSSDARRLAVFSQDATDYSLGYLSIIDLESDTLLYSGYSSPFYDSPRFSPDNRSFIRTSNRYIGGQVYESRIHFLDIASGLYTDWEIGGYMGITAGRLAWNPNGSLIAVQIGGSVKVYTTETMEEITSFQVDTYNFYDLAWNTDGSEIVTYGTNIRRWNAATGHPIS